MLPLARLQETLHQHPEQVNPAHSPGTPGPSLALQPGLVSGRGTSARAGKQKGKHSWGGQGSPRGVLSPCGQFLEGREHPKLIQYHPPHRPPSRVAVPHVPHQTLTAPRQQHPATMVVLSTLLASPLRLTLAALCRAAPRQHRGFSTPSGPGHSLNLGGIFPPLTTPFSPTQEVDYAQLEGNLRRYASIPFRGKCCLLPLSMRAPARPLPTTGAVWQRAGSLLASQGCSASLVPHLGLFTGQMPRHTRVSLHTPTTLQCVLACTLPCKYPPHIATGLNILSAP